MTDRQSDMMAREYKDYGNWSKAVLKSAICHAASAMKDEETYKAPTVYLIWLTKLANHLNDHYE